MKLKLLLSILLIGLLSGCSSSSGSGEGSTEETIAVKKLDNTPEGKNVEVVATGEGRVKDFIFSNAKDKAVIAVYWSTNCPACIAEIPHLNKIQKKYEDNLSVIGILVQDKDKKEIDEFVAYHGINYDILYGDGSYDLADAMGGVRAIPAFFIFNKQGKLQKNFVGLLPPEVLEAEIKNLL